MVYELKDLVAIVTGAATGIGALVVRKIVEEGSKHVAVLDVNQKAGTDFENELNAKYGAGKVKFYFCDVTNEELMVGIFKEVVETQGGLDLLVNNAAIMNESMYRKMIPINVTALVTGTLKAIEIMSKENGGKGGTVINISSSAALSQEDYLPVYFATKSAVQQFSNCYGRHAYYLKNGVRVVTVCFGATDTPLLDLKNIGVLALGDALEKELLSVVPTQKPESAAQGVVDAFKYGKSGSTWLAVEDLPVKDITATVTKAYDLMNNEVRNPRQ